MRSIRLTGSEFALIRSAVFMAVRWPSPRHSNLVFRDSNEIENQLRSQHGAFLKAAGLPDPWHGREHAKARQAASGTVQLAAATVVAIVNALRWCHAEFRDPHGWIDFCVAATDDIAAYDDLKPASLLLLADRLSDVV